MNILAKFWKLFKAWGNFLQPAMLSIIVLALGFIVLVVLPQGKDAVLGLSEASFFDRVIFSLVSLVWALQIWYWARVSYIIRDFHLSKRSRAILDDGEQGGESFYPMWVKKFVPRGLGLLAFIVVMMSLFSMAIYADNTALWRQGQIFIVLTFLFLIFIIYRRPLFNLPALKDVLAEINEKCRAENREAVFSDLPKRVKITVYILSAFSLTYVTLIIIDPHTFTFANGASVALACFSAWVPIGSWILFHSYKWRFPLFTILIILAVFFAMFNDNHLVRVMENVKPVQQCLDHRVDEFLKKYPSVNEGSKETSDVTRTQEQPLVIVATEGGGIRAAYWTSVVLGAVQDKDGDFSKHIFAISSVSGGSLGAAVFTALVKEHQTNPRESFFKDAGEVLKADFLSPTVGAMLTGDLLQRIIPFPIKYFSRGLALEKAFEYAWHDAIKSHRFSEAFTGLWQGDEKSCNIPSLLLNGTHVESGKRLIASNIHFSHLSHLLDAEDIYDYLWENTNKDREMRLSTAVNNSCRFTYVSPAGTLNDGTHVVDGGYFDNSGGSTALEVLSFILDRLKENPRRLKIVGIVITNNPNVPEVKPLTLLSGVLAPLVTFMNAWNSHALYSKCAFKEMIEDNDGIFLHFKLRSNKLNLPLGWSLSQEVRRDLNEQAKEQVDKLWPPVKSESAELECH